MDTYMVILCRETSQSHYVVVEAEDQYQAEKLAYEKYAGLRNPAWEEDDWAGPVYTASVELSEDPEFDRFLESGES